MRTIFYDTETTGKEYQKGHRVVEVAFVEMIDGELTGNNYHSLINPERDIPAEVVLIHGITNEMVANAPKFKDVLPDILEFIRGADMVAHNAEFDEKFLNNEMEIAKHNESFWGVVGDTKDSIDMSRKIWRGKDPATIKDDGKGAKNYKHNLDVVMDRCGIDRSKRVNHGALIDSQLLAEAFLAMKKLIEDMGPTLEDDVQRKPVNRIALTKPLPVVAISDEALKIHEDLFAPKSNGMKL